MTRSRKVVAGSLEAKYVAGRSKVRQLLCGRGESGFSRMPSMGKM